MLVRHWHQIWNTCAFYYNDGLHIRKRNMAVTNVTILESWWWCQLHREVCLLNQGWQVGLDGSLNRTRRMTEMETSYCLTALTAEAARIQIMNRISISQLVPSSLYLLFLRNYWYFIKLYTVEYFSTNDPQGNGSQSWLCIRITLKAYWKFIFSNSIHKGFWPQVCWVRSGVGMFDE